ncbi:hypothetical protein BH10BAC3_BH10BAC3_29780 [soil metagenome]
MRLLKNYFITLALLCWVVFAKGQNILPSFIDNQTPGVLDYVIPDNIVYINVDLAGAQGGSTLTDCKYEGGKGQGWSFTLSVGQCDPNSLRPGGLLRLVTGERGQSVPAPNIGGAGGGGGTALLYQPPGTLDWTILAVGGGGGGAAFFLFNLGNNCQGSEGVDATSTLLGTDGLYTFIPPFPPGVKGTYGNGGSSPSTLYSFGGGGAFGDGTTTGDQACSGKKGYPSGGARGSCGLLFRYFGGFGFGSGGGGYLTGGGGGGFSGGGGGGGRNDYPRGGGGGGSFRSGNFVSGVGQSQRTGGGFIRLSSLNGFLTPPISLASSTLPPRDVSGCNVNQSADLGLSTEGSQTTITLASFNALGGVINPGGCSFQSITYTDTLEQSNPTRVVNRTYTVTDQGGNIARCKQVVTVRNPGFVSTISPTIQYTCANVAPASITVSVVTQFGITAQWYRGESPIFSEAAAIQGAINLTYIPPAPTLAETIYYFCRIVDGCGSANVRTSRVIVTAIASTWYKDTDGDNYYDPAGTITACASPGAAYKTAGLLGVDCNDNDATILPGAAEICDGKDNNCNGTIDENCCPIGNVLYVRQNAAGLNNGSNWLNAFTRLQSALASTCTNVTQIWVAAGTYRPTATTDRSIAFVMKNNLAIYGGFAGNETDVTKRRPTEHPTILSGDIGTLGIRTDNSFNVVRNDGNGLTATAILDGFIVRDGNANEIIYTRSRGAGIFNYFVSPTIRNCQLIANSANTYGGGIFNEEGSPLIINTIVAGNTANFGGGVYNELATPVIVNCSFSGNLASTGGGAMHTFGNLSPQVRNTIMWGNSSGISNNLATPVIANSLVQTNPNNLAQDSIFILKPTPGLGNVGDLRLLPCSPAIDKGNVDYFLISPAPYLDIAGNFRFFNGAVDIGAYEHQYSYSIVYVDIAATGTNDGSSWANAYSSLEVALRDMNYCEGTNKSSTIYLAKGFYTLTANAAALLNRTNASLLGGYPSGGGERDAATNLVVIKGNVRALKSVAIDGVKVEQ